MRFPQLHEMPLRRDQVKSVLLWPMCALLRHAERHEIAAADTVSWSEFLEIIAGIRPRPEHTGRTIRYFTCRCGAHTREQPV